jgi:hypothetical protein
MGMIVAQKPATFSDHILLLVFGGLLSTKAMAMAMAIKVVQPLWVLLAG